MVIYGSTENSKADRARPTVAAMSCMIRTVMNPGGRRVIWEGMFGVDIVAVVRRSARESIRMVVVLKRSFGD